MVVGSFEPGPPKPATALPDGSSRPAVNENWFGLEYQQYPIVYTAKIVLTVAAMLFVLPGYRQFPFRISPLAIVVGVVGVVLWIEICKLGLEQHLVEKLGPQSKIVGWLGLSERPAYDPLSELAGTPAWAYIFLGIRFLGLALIVPIIEEFFLRRLLDAFRDPRELVASPFRASDDHGSSRRYISSNVDSSRKTGRYRLVQPC